MIRMARLCGIQYASFHKYHRDKRRAELIALSIALGLPSSDESIFPQTERINRMLEPRWQEPASNGQGNRYSESTSVLRRLRQKHTLFGRHFT